MPPHPLLHPHRRNFVSSLKVCAMQKDVKTGLVIHSEIARFSCLDKDVIIGSSLVNLYAKCGLFAKAKQVLEKLPKGNAVAWNALIGGHIEGKDGIAAMECFERMQHELVLPDDVTFFYLAKACRHVGTKECRKIHGELARRGLLEENSLVGSNLVDSYARLGSLLKAQEVFDMLPIRDVVCWTAMIRGYFEQGCSETAIVCFEQMQLEGIAPDAVTYVCSLQACGSLGHVVKGEALHREIATKGFLRGNFVLGTALVDMYARCGVLTKAQEVFDELPSRNVVTWTSLITGYSECGHGEKALECFQLMQSDGVPPNTATFLITLKACSSIDAIDKGEEIHADIEKKGLLEEDIVLGNALVDMYMKCGGINKAQDVFDTLPSRNLVSWNTLIAGYVEHGCVADALKHFKHMNQMGLSPDGITYACILKACGNLQDLEFGQEMHAQISGKGLLERDSSLGSALVDMYAKCSSLAKAQEAFDRLRVQDTIAWTTLIAGYAEVGQAERVLVYLQHMNQQGIPMNPVTLGCGLRACGCLRATYEGQNIHAEIERCGLLQCDPTIGNALIYMYAKSGWLLSAQEVFSKLQGRDVITWNALITGYTVNDRDEETLKFVDQMRLDGVVPDFVTFVCSLKACGCLGAIDKGLEIHAEILKRGLLEQELVLGNSLIDMYSKCGLLTLAHQVFNMLPVRDAVSWNSLLVGHTLLGHSESVFEMLGKMLGEYVKPTLVTLTIVLTACSHMGLYERSQTYFEALSNEYGIVPTLEHHACMIDLLSRLGRVHKAIHMIKEMPFSADIVVWQTVLSACRKWGNFELGKQAFKHAAHMAECHSGPYVMYSQLCADTKVRMIEALEKQASDSLACKDPLGGIETTNSISQASSGACKAYPNVRHFIKPCPQLSSVANGLELFCLCVCTFFTPCCVYDIFLCVEILSFPYDPSFSFLVCPYFLPSKLDLPKKMQWVWSYFVSVCTFFTPCCVYDIFLCVEIYSFPYDPSFSFLVCPYFLALKLDLLKKMPLTL
ncbi:hypothetical protein GOP47_0027904 [Adiantum capillus-veneris]|nr:hypothetical protein GOP47_0027904 [Adiantum capillus-veneris]